MRKRISISLTAALPLLVLAWAGTSADAPPRNRAPKQRATGGEFSLKVLPRSKTEPGEVPKTQEQRNAEELRKALQARVDVNYAGTKLTDVLKDLSQDGKRFRVKIDREVIEDDGTALDESMVRLKLKNVTVEQVLHWSLGPFGLAWLPTGGELFVTTASKADVQLVTRKYNIAPLVSPQASLRLRKSTAPFSGISLFRRPSDHDWLVDMLTIYVRGSWLERLGVGGSASIFDDTLTVHQTRDVHDTVQGLLGCLHLAANGKLEGGMAFARRSYYPHAQDASIRRKLRQPITIQSTSSPVRDVLDKLSRKTGLPIVVDELGLKDEGVDIDKSVVSIAVRGVPLNSVLQRVLPSNLVFVVEEGALLATTGAKASDEFRAAVFDVGDLVKAGIRPDELVSAVVFGTSGRWSSRYEGVTGNVGFNEDLKILVVDQTMDIHEEIAALLQGLRNARKKITVKPKTTQPGRESFELRFYKMFDARRASQLANAIPAAVAPESWKADKATIRVVGSVVIVRQTGTIHGQLRRFLKKLEAAEQKADGTGPLFVPAGPSVLPRPPPSGFFSR